MKNEILKNVFGIRHSEQVLQLKKTLRKRFKIVSVVMNSIVLRNQISVLDAPQSIHMFQQKIIVKHLECRSSLNTWISSIDVEHALYTEKIFVVKMTTKFL